MKVEELLDKLRNGAMLKRESWDSHTFIFMQVPSDISTDIVPKMQSLPDTVKDEFMRRYKLVDQFHSSQIHYMRQVAICDANNNIRGYALSPDELLAEDWIEYVGHMEGVDVAVNN